MDVRISDEALFVVPKSGALWSYDFGRTKRVIREARDEATDPPFQVAQARADGRALLLVFPTLGGVPSIAEQDAIRQLLGEYAGSRAIAFVFEQAPGHVAVLGSDVELVEHVAAAVAVVQTCWGWDESIALKVNVDELEFLVAPRFDGEVWTARPQRVKR